MDRFVRLVGVALMVAMMGLVALVPSAAQAQSRLCFAEVPDCIEGRFAEYWQENGGLAVFGFPITPARLEQVGGGQFLVQVFERNRFELHPENQRPYDVLLGRLGDDRLNQLGRPWQNEAKATSTSQPGCQYFAQTQHLVCDAFLRYWTSNGLKLDTQASFSEAESLALFGLPLTEAKIETGSDGRQYLTQWFERARFELHPEIGPSAVLLGLLGREMQAPPPAPPAPQPTPPPADPCADVPEPRNGAIRPAKCVEEGTAIVMDIFGFRPNEEIGFWLTSPDGVIVGTRRTLNIGPTGSASGLEFPTDGLEPGIWYFVFEGVRSKNQSVIYFKILGDQPTPPPSGGDTSVPPSQNAQVNPASGRGGTVFSAQGFGFQPGESIGVYVTAPDQSVFGAPFQVEADDSGVSGVVSLRTGRDFPPGVWAFTFEGVKSGHKAIAYFRILP